MVIHLCYNHITTLHAHAPWYSIYLTRSSSSPTTSSLFDQVLLCSLLDQVHTFCLLNPGLLQQPYSQFDIPHFQSTWPRKTILKHIVKLTWENHHIPVQSSSFASCFVLLFSNLSLFSNLTSLLWSESPIQPRNSQISKTLRTDTGMCSLNLPNDKDS